MTVSPLVVWGPGAFRTMWPSEFNKLDLARRVSLTSTFDRIKIGAALINHGTLVSIGSNRPKSHPMQAKYNNIAKRVAPRHHLHAEMMALVNAKGEKETTNGATIYVYRQLANGSLGNSRPCAACEAALKEAGVCSMLYTTTLGFVAESLSANA